MSETPEQERVEKVVEAEASDGALKRARVASVRETVERRSQRAAIVAIVSVFAIIALALLLWFWRTRNEGRPVPAPRTITTEQQASTQTTATTETTLRLSSDAARAGVKIETVGEQLATGENAGGAATGVVQANAYRETPVVALVGGIVRSVNVELGQNTQRGQTVATVFSDELASAQSRYLSALADLEEHEKHHRRTAQLVEIGAASREEFEQATAKMKTAESEVANMRQRLLLLGLTSQKVAALRSTSQISSELSLPAPASGTVTSRTVNPGEVIEANKELLRVTDLSSVWVVGQVYEKDLAQVRVGSGASITSDAYPNKIFRGRISYVDPRLDTATRTAQVRIELANPGQVLKIGMYVNVAFATINGSESTVPVVPTVAVQNINNQQVVFVATDDPNIFIMRPVRLGPESQGRYTVLEGLSVGEKIVTEGSFMLRAEWLKTHPNG